MDAKASRTVSLAPASLAAENLHAVVKKALGEWGRDRARAGRGAGVPRGGVRKVALDLGFQASVPAP
eukprot:11184170-Lingulodinium_polyedra.AAC.1